MNQVFVDSSYFKALIDKDDDFHNTAIDIFSLLKKQKTHLITTNYIVDETLTLLRAKTNLQAATKLRDMINIGSPTITIYRVASGDDADAWYWFMKNWSKLSFTDCVSFSVMKRLDLTHVVTFDQHFRRAGFTIVKPQKRNFANTES